MNQAQLPSKGSRFVMHDTEYEIQYVHNDSVRYSTVNGGKTFSLSINQYNSLVSEDAIAITHNAELIVSEENIKKLARKMKYIKAVLTGCNSYLRKTWVVNIIAKTAGDIGEAPPSYHTVRKWIKTYRKHGQNKLVPIKQGNQHARFDCETEMIVSEEIQNALKKGLVLVGVEIHAAIVNRLVKVGQHQEQATIHIPSVRHIQRRICKIDYFHRLIAKFGKAKANTIIRASGKKVIVPYPMSVVQIDTHYLDLIVVDPDTFRPLGRPFLVVIKCIYTRKIVGHYISLFPPSATTTLQAMKMMLLHFGCPSVIIPDRGVEFVNSAFFHLCNELLITLELSQVKEPNHKANVESFFRTITSYVVQRMEGTTHSNVLARGDYDSEGKSIYTLDQVNFYVDIWINEVYDVRPHSQTMRAPKAMWEKAISEVPLLKLEAEEIENLARVPDSKTVHQGRVLVNYLTYYSHALTRLNGKKVVVLVDETDLETVYIKDTEDPSTLIKADSTEPHYTKGLTLNQHLEVRNELKLLSEAEMNEIGEHKWQLGLARLMEKILADSLSNKKKKRATNGQRAADTAIHDKTVEAQENKSVESSDSPIQRAKNQQKKSRTNNPIYVDNTGNNLAPEQIVEHDVWNI
jgi:putative transposase